MEPCPADAQSSARSKMASSETPTRAGAIFETADSLSRLDEDRANSVTDEGGPSQLESVPDSKVE
jgi:hypothetical protein